MSDADPTLSYLPKKRRPRRTTWLATALEIEGGILVLLSLSCCGLSIFGWAASFSSFFAVLLLMLLCMALGIGLVLAGLALRGDEPWAPLVGSLLAGVLAAPFAIQAATAFLAVWSFGGDMLTLLIAFFVSTVATFQAILIVALWRDWLRSRRR